MQINTNSWHYKLYRFTYTALDSYPPGQTNLCQYVQRTFWGTLLNITIGAFFALGFAVLITGIAKLIWHYPLICLGTISAIILWVAIVVAFLRWRPNRSETVRLAQSWFAAKTQGICPVVVFKDEPTSLDE
jgi:uncharacterized membrane protein